MPPLGVLQQSFHWPIDIMVRMFANGLRDLGSIPDQVIPKTQKMVFDTCLLNTQHYKVRIKGKRSNSEKEGALSQHYTRKRKYHVKRELNLTVFVNNYFTRQKRSREEIKDKCKLPIPFTSIPFLIEY